MEQQIHSANPITGIVILIIGAIAGISLFVDDIGVMNIMLVSVTERTRGSASAWPWGPGEEKDN